MLWSSFAAFPNISSKKIPTLAVPVREYNTTESYTCFSIVFLHGILPFVINQKYSA